MLAERLWQACWQGTLLALAVWAVSKLFPKLPASARTTLWWLVCLKLVIGLVPIQPVELYVLPPAPSISQASASEFKPSLPNASNQEPNAALGGTRKARAAEPETTRWPGGLAALWGLGVLILAGRYVRDAMRLKSLLRGAKPIQDKPILETASRLCVAMGLSRVPRILETDQGATPMVVGFWSPTILIPAHIASKSVPADIEMLLAHELAHIRRRDLPAAWIPLLSNLLFFFLPTAWIACRQWETEREAACDELVLEVTGASPASYGKLLLRMVPVEGRPGPSIAIGATAQFHTLRKRLTMIKNRVPVNRRVRVVALSLTALAGLLIIPWRVSAAQTETLQVSMKSLKDVKAEYWKLDVKIPQFNDNGPVAALANKEALTVAKEFDGFLDAAKKRVADNNERNDFELTRTPKVTVARKDLISYYWEYKKCPDFFHTETYLRSAAYGIVNGKAKKLTISDLFLPGVDGDREVSKVVYEKLKEVFPRQYAKESVMPNSMVYRDNQFSIEPGKLLIHFPSEHFRPIPSENGEASDMAYKVEGLWYVEVPLRALDGLNPNGPLRGLIK